MKLEWSGHALADLDRFARFLHDRYPAVARVVARQIIDKASLLAESPLLGRPVAGHEDYRQIVLRVLNAAYVIQYPIEGERVIVLRVFYGRENRDR